MYRGAASGPGTSSGNEGLGSLTGIGSRAGSKGLRHFSMKVCEKVESKQRTTYNEVADELVAELPLTSNAGAHLHSACSCPSEFIFPLNVQ